VSEDPVVCVLETQNEVSSNFIIKMVVAGLFARDDGPNACQMAYEMQPYIFIGKPEGMPSVGEPMPARADDTEIHLEDMETIKADVH